jgi:hypothetical protein
LSINHSVLSSWADEFIPAEISTNITHLDGPDYREREGYVADLDTDNFENDLHAAAANPSPDGDTVFASGSLCADLRELARWRV